MCQVCSTIHPPLQIYRCTQIANVKSKDILKKINEALSQCSRAEKGTATAELKQNTIKSTVTVGEEMTVPIEKSPVEEKERRKEENPIIRELVSL